jgi:DNA (cytosine-5)-methyltransferase 1
VILDLCSGVGWSEGLRSLGLREVGIDLDPAVCATRRAAGFETIRADVATFPTGQLVGKVTGLIASPPCQAFSRAGKRLGMGDLPALYELVERVRRTGIWPSLAGRRWHDDRSPLVLEPLRFAGAILPAWIALEQIPDALPLWRRYAHILERWGYRTWCGVLNTADYGVAQTRERAILMASRTGPVRPPEPTHSDQRRGGSLFGLAPWISMAEALGWGWGDTPARTVCGDRGPRWAYPAGDGPECRTGRVLAVETEQTSEHAAGRVPYLRDADRPAPTVTAETGASDQWRIVMGASDNATHRTLDEPAPTVLCGHQGNNIRWTWRSNTQAHAARRTLDEPASTIFAGGRLNDISWVRERPATTVQGTPRIGRPGHKDRDHGGESQHEQSVRVTLDELAILQGFDAGYPWQGNKSQRATQVGNAVPPPLAAAIVGTLLGLDWRAAA